MFVKCNYCLLYHHCTKEKDSLLPFPRKQGVINEGQPSPRGKKRQRREKIKFRKSEGNVKISYNLRFKLSTQYYSLFCIPDGGGGGLTIPEAKCFKRFIKYFCCFSRYKSFTGSSLKLYKALRTFPELNFLMYSLHEKAYLWRPTMPLKSDSLMTSW